ncbi:MAG TPA: signal peptidase I [Alphaproteobacteria bacterium]|mgnify:FL=1|nr:signal peptidase I [Alphaproteobacteria bacterium]
MEEKNTQGGFWETTKTVVYAVVIALFVRTFFAEPFSIPSGSMIPTLLVGDYLFVSKMSYGYSRHSLPLSLPLIKNRIFYTEPKRGDVIVFKMPSDNKTDYIKRLIGLPGDRIQVREGRLYINGDMVDRQSAGEYVMRDPRGKALRFEKYIETLPEGVKHPVLEISDDAPFDNTVEFTVPEDHFFMMGDNRDNSLDSRSVKVGFVPKNNLVGRAKFLFFSNDGSAAWWQIWKWPMAVRWSRLFNGIE